MAICIEANLAKLVPIPGPDFSSQQASITITITAEVGDPTMVGLSMSRVFFLNRGSLPVIYSGVAGFGSGHLG